MKKKKSTERARSIAIVAHPDDETIWMGGALMKIREFDWTIFSLCRRSDPDRAPKFFRVCRFYKAKPIMTDMDDEGNLSYEEAVLEAKKIIKKEIGKSSFDCVFTHGAKGEYGHILHKAVHTAVKELVKDKILKPRAVFYFDYRKIGRKKYAPLIPEKGTDLIIELSPKEFKRKKDVVSKIYGFDSKGIDVNLSTNPEAYKITIN